MPEKRWKAQERRVANLLNCTRVKKFGEPGPDCENQFLKVEVKDRLRLPVWLVYSLNQARSFANPRQLGLLVITSSSTRQVLVVLDLEDYRAWYIKTPKKGTI